MKDLNENNDNNKGFFVALTSIATVCIIIFLGTIIFFPNKNLASDIAEKNIVLEEDKDPNTLEKVDQNEKSLKVSETQNEIIIDLTQDLNKEKKPTNKIPNTQKSKIIEKPQPTTQKISNTSQKSKTIEKPQPTTQKTSNTSQKSKTIEKPQPTTQKISNTSQKSKTIEKPQPIAQKTLNTDNIYDPNIEYYIQFVSLSDPINADNYIQKLLKYNIIARIYSATVDNKDIYRVRSGPYKTKSEAKADFKKIAGIGEFKETYILPVNK
ncbi:SPOR domain-containing protein [Borreliella burgdorferi]|uniref:SPOR domain-containing protein n=1 Tax=Borreliella burgdorferi TaxID=139 RepID=UPI0004013F4C|nr:SPOR domain-containing protein [Borreliella burgdorferi]QXG44242.1 SPOR domain-containing protein [Borreliella burgdorferi]WNY59476.1 SPOR domain-containing protein [Borreliella burgdorferi]WNY61181.1 SPOR domain-containing protein [Borreliella burgdorferi]WNY62075.1 SPOR domain-containing protein [Borreliella burgdorferi]